MAERTLLNPSQAKEVEEQLFSTLRQQVGRSVPMPLPRGDFWKKVSQLLDTVEMEIHEVYKTVGPSLKMQTLQKRQANIRRTASELARKRMVALMQHSASMALRTEGGSQGQDLAAMDWSRHDPAEREFYANATEQLNKFKQAVNWNNMQMGIASEELNDDLRMAPGTTQLDSFVPGTGGLTGQGPPKIAIEENNAPLEEYHEDEEEHLAKSEEFPELAGKQPIEEIPTHEPSTGESHAAAMELAPSKKKEEMDFDAWANVDAASSEVEEPLNEEELDIEEGNLLRIRILESLDEPIITIDGEITLGIGDVLFLDEMTANYLVESGVAEIATL
ncbi:MAG: hypothetical protein CMB55_04510 [Euryarchaeota archaeon]|nr:hypothetical protein [Euryarchaeota archaeon]